MELKWTTALEIGHEIIDDQHKELFGAFDEFVDGCANGKGKETLLKLHEHLALYTKNHFQEEEALMQGSGYPDLESHRREHQRFQKDLADLRGKISAEGATLMSLVQSNKVLVAWLVNHVQDTDQRFGHFINKD